MISDLAARCLAAPPRAGRVRVIAVDGPSGSGKSTLAAALATALGGAPVVPMDDLYPGWDGLADAVPRLLEWVLLPLAAGQPPRYRRYDWPRGEYAEWVDLPGAPPTLIVEGVGSGSTACAPYVSLVVWVDAPEDVRFARGIERDGETYRPHWQRWAVQEAEHFAREGTRARADVRVDGLSNGLSEAASSVLAVPSAVPGTLAVRSIDPDSDELLPWLGLAALVFKDPGGPTPERTEFRRPVYRQQRLTAAYDDHDRLVGTYRSWDVGLTTPGGRVTADAISSVTVRPTHRRRGALTALIAADLAGAVSRGTPAAVLIASEATIYSRFGFGIATEAATWTVDLAQAAFRADVPMIGTVDVVEEASLREIAPAVFERSRRPGTLDRDDHWWDSVLGITPFPGEPHTRRVAVVHIDDGGAVDGYLRYRVKDHWDERICQTAVLVDDLEAVTPAAYAGLWRYLTELDMVATVRAEYRPVDEALPWMLIDRRAARMVSRADFLWIRVLDTAAALSSRVYRAGECVLEVVDPSGWAAGRFALESDGASAGTCRATDAAPDVTLPVATLSEVWLGGSDLSACAVAGQVAEHRAGAVDRLGAMLATPRLPWTNTWF